MQANTEAALNQHGAVMIGDLIGDNLILSSTEIQARNNGAAAPLMLNEDGGTIFAPGLQNIGDRKDMQYDDSTGEIGWDNSSRRYKINIETLNDDWSKILNARPVRYSRPNSPNHWEYGYIAEEIDSIGLTNLVGYDKDGIPDDVKYDRMVLYLKEIARMQQDEIIRINQELNTLRRQVYIPKSNEEGIESTSASSPNKP